MSNDAKNDGDVAKTIKDLLQQFNDLKPNYEKFKEDSHPLARRVAEAERLHIFIGTLTPHADLFKDSFKERIQEYLIVYKEARKGFQWPMKKTIELVDPIDKLIRTTLETYSSTSANE